MIKAIIFDFDGVIWDTYEINFALSKTFDSSISEQDFRDHHNGNVFEKPKIQFKPEDIPVFFAKQKKLFTERNLFPVINILKSLASDYKLFIVSSTVDENIVYFLGIGQILPLFWQVLWSTTHRSKVEKFKMIFDAYNLAKDECIFVTDTIWDIKEAKHLDLLTIAVSWGYHPTELLQKEEPFTIVDNPEALLKIIHELS